MAGSGFFTSANAAYFFYGPDGQSVGSFGALDGALKANFDINYEPVSDSYPAQVPQSYVTQVGDTLRIVAAKLYGDPSLWYVIAQANGLSEPDEQIPAGRNLTIPNDVVSLANNSSSFKPFDIADALGDTTPTQPLPPPPQPRKKKGCGVIGMIIVIVVAIIVTVYTAGAAAGAFSSGAASAGGGAAAGGAAGTFGTGAAVLGGTAGISTGGMIAAAAVGGAAGSIASQGVAMALGLQDKFNWSGVALGAIGAGVGAGLGGSATFANTVSKIAQGNTYVAAGISAAAGNALTQGISVAVGLQPKFDWRSVAISAVSAPLASFVGEKVGGWASGSVGVYRATVAGNVYNAARFLADTASTLTSSAVRLALGGEVDVQQVVADIFGNALANSIVSKIHLSSSAGTSRSVDQLEEVQITARRLDNNPTNTIRAGSEISPDEISAAAAPPAGGIETVFSTAPRWRLGEELIYQDLWLTSLSSGIRPNGDYLAAKAQDTYVDNIQRQNTAMLISGFTPIGQIPLVVEGAVNLLGKAASGILALPALGGGLDRAAAVQERFEDNLRIDLDTRFFDAFGQSLAPGLNRVHGALEDTIGIGPTAALGALAEFGLDASAVLLRIR